MSKENCIVLAKCKRTVLWICRKLVGVRVSQVKPSNCFRLHPTSVIYKHSTIPVPVSL